MMRADVLPTATTTATAALHERLLQLEQLLPPHAATYDGVDTFARRAEALAQSPDALQWYALRNLATSDNNSNNSNTPNEATPTTLLCCPCAAYLVCVCMAHLLRGAPAQAATAVQRLAHSAAAAAAMAAASSPAVHMQLLAVACTRLQRVCARSLDTNYAAAFAALHAAVANVMTAADDATATAALRDSTTGDDDKRRMPPQDAVPLHALLRYVTVGDSLEDSNSAAAAAATQAAAAVTGTFVPACAHMLTATLDALAQRQCMLLRSVCSCTATAAQLWPSSCDVHAAHTLNMSCAELKRRVRRASARVYARVLPDACEDETDAKTRHEASTLLDSVRCILLLPAA